MRVEFIEETKSYLNIKHNLYAPIRSGLLSDDPESLAMRLIPSPPGQKYYEGEIHRIQFQILAKSQDEAKVISTLEDIRDTLDGWQGHATSAFSLVLCEAYTEPNFVERNERQEYIYTALFNAELEEV